VGLHGAGGCAVRRTVPRVAAAGIVDSVVDGRTGWIVPDLAGFAPAMIDALRLLAADGARFSEECRDWAAQFTWERSAELLAGVVAAEVGARAFRRRRDRRTVRSDMTTAVRFRIPSDVPRPRARVTDQLTIDGEYGSALLHGCDEIDGEAVLLRWNVEPISVGLATETQLLTGVQPVVQQGIAR